jgi:hypothetical protein
MAHASSPTSTILPTGQRILDRRRDSQQLHGSEESRITESFDVAIFLPTLKHPDQHGPYGEDHHRQTQCDQQPRE